MSYRAQASRPDYSEEVEPKPPAKSFGEMWRDFKKSRREAIDELHGWKKTISMMAHGAGLIFVLFLLPVLFFLTIGFIFGPGWVVKAVLAVVIASFCLFIFLIICEIIFETS